MVGAPVRAGDVLLGKYRVERVLGRGGMGVVLAARHVELGELFAIKFLLPEALESPDAVDRFLREARAAARLKGEHAAKVHDVGRLGTGAPYMVMEYLDGFDLKAFIKVRGPLRAEEASALLLQVCEALAEAHAAGIIHRDLKPANLFLTRRPNGTACMKVLDFGISKQLTSEDAELTRSGTILGSPLYMSPEQMARTRGADARSDVWSLGVVLYELVTGSPPFAAQSLTEVVARVLQEEPPPPSKVRAGLPAELDAIVARCLKKRPEHRFQSVHELAAALEALCDVRASAMSLSPPMRVTPPPGQGSWPGVDVVRGSPSQADLSARSPDASSPDAAPGSTSVTSSTWVGGRLRSGAGRAGLVTALVLVGAGLAIVGVWFVRQQPLETVTETPPGKGDSAATGATGAQASPSSIYAEPAMGSAGTPAPSTAPTGEVAATISPTGAPAPSVGPAPIVMPSSTLPGGGNGPPPPRSGTAGTTKRAPASTTSPAPTATTTTKKHRPLF